MELRRVASGMESGSTWQLPHMRNSRITLNSSPLPTSSSMYSHRNCMTRINVTTARTAMNDPVKAFRINWSSFFI